mmetsp:Transcript_20125/g.59765  ORF Transcript_20125/g.59765 Transcript_20125/m.59765 type:complete len:366 (+) Transcript_20125:427-1524(+)
MLFDASHMSVGMPVSRRGRSRRAAANFCAAAATAGLLICACICRHLECGGRPHTRAALHIVSNKRLQLVDCNIGHDDDMCNAALTRELPLADKRLFRGPLKHDRIGQLVERRLDARLGQHLPQRVRVSHAPLHIGLHAVVALARQLVPQVDGCMAVARAHDCCVAAVEVLHISRQGHHVLEAGDDDAAWHRRADKLVATDANRADWLLERHHRRILQERHHHAKQRAIAVNKEAVLCVASLLQDGQHTVQVVHCALHRRPDVHIDDSGPRPVPLQVGTQLLIVNLARLQRGDLDSVHAVHASGLKDRVMRLTRRVQNAVGVVLASNQDAVQVALCAARRDVSPVLLLVNLPQLGKPVEHANLFIA